MIRITCETFPFGWQVIVTHVAGLKETPISQGMYNRHTCNDATEALGMAVREAYSYIRSDEPEVPEHT